MKKINLIKRSSIFLLFTLLSLNLSAQQYLYIKKGGELPAERLGLHERIKVKISDTTDWVSGNLRMISAEAIRLDEQVFALKDIDAIRTHNGLLQITGTAIWGAGVLFTSIALVNGIINRDNPVIYPGQVIFGAGMVGGGALVSILSRKTYRRSKGYTYEVIDLNQDYSP